MPRIAPAPRQDYGDVVLCAPVTVPYERYSPQSAQWWIGRALKALVDTAGLEPKDLDGFLVSSFSLFPDAAIGLTQHYGLSPRWLDHIPMGGASGILSLRKAARAVQNGDCSIAACVAGDTNHVDMFRKSLSTFSRFAQDAVFPYGSGGPNASFALIARNYMAMYGATREDFGKLAVAQRQNALANPNALMKKPLTLDEYLNARMISDPIGLFDCVMPCAGAEAFLVMREAEAKALGLPFVRLLGTIERHNAHAGDPMQHRGGWTVDIGELWAMAGAKPSDLSFIQTYDDYPVISTMQLEDLGLCAKGEAKDFIRANTFTADGTCPHNTSGGQLSAGQAGCGGGFIGITESIRQLTDSARGTQVKDARLGLVSGFGMITYDRGLASGAALLGRA
ncbi:thiolase family protein [uncultured Alsobacter sp.]|uniref:thiolase family protein n=1 Tax=uncultured Alsobacter sp. TaxID=1748258 RepID=UPI0025CDFBAC|nr:thiolase family protein [uncultured Alsobacter sp.]